MDPSRWRRVREVFESVLRAPIADRAARLDEMCGVDAELRGAVEVMLVEDAKSGEGIGVPSA